MVVRALFTGLAGLMLAACQHQSAPAPAKLADAKPDTMKALKAGLSPALGRASFEFGAGDPTQTSSVSVLPPRPVAQEGNSPALPILFDLFIEGETCFAVQQGTSTRIPLPGVACRPA